MSRARSELYSPLVTLAGVTRGNCAAITHGPLTPKTCDKNTCYIPFAPADDDKIMQAAEDARKKKQAEQAKRAEKEHEQEQDWGSMPGTLVRELAIRQQQKKKGKKAMFAEAEGDGDVQVSVKQGAGGKVRLSAGH